MKNRAFNTAKKVGHGADKPLGFFATLFGVTSFLLWVVDYFALLANVSIFSWPASTAVPVIWSVVFVSVFLTMGLIQLEKWINKRRAEKARAQSQDLAKLLQPRNKNKLATFFAMRWLAYAGLTAYSVHYLGVTLLAMNGTTVGTGFGAAIMDVLVVMVVVLSLRQAHKLYQRYKKFAAQVALQKKYPAAIPTDQEAKYDVAATTQVGVEEDDVDPNPCAVPQSDADSDARSDATPSAKKRTAAWCEDKANWYGVLTALISVLVLQGMIAGIFAGQGMSLTGLAFFNVMVLVGSVCIAAGTTVTRYLHHREAKDDKRYAMSPSYFWRMGLTVSMVNVYIMSESLLLSQYLKNGGSAISVFSIGMLALSLLVTVALAYIIWETDKMETLWASVSGTLDAIEVPKGGKVLSATLVTEAVHGVVPVDDELGGDFLAPAKAGASRG